MSLQQLQLGDHLVTLGQQQFQFGAARFRLLLVEVAHRPVAGPVEGFDLLQLATVPLQVLAPHPDQFTVGQRLAGMAIPS